MKQLSNEERLRQLAADFFDVKNDPEQLQVDEAVLEMLTRLHPKAVCEERCDEGPIAWTLIIPTTYELMEEFLKKEINENELLYRTPFPCTFEAVYLCSALVLPEYQRKGIAKRMLTNAVQALCSEYPIRALFYWSWSEAGTKLAHSVATACGLPLYQREK